MMALRTPNHACKIVMGSKACAGGVLDGLCWVRCYLMAGKYGSIMTSEGRHAVLTEGAKILLQARASAEAAMGKVDLRLAAQHPRNLSGTI